MHTYIHIHTYMQTGKQTRRDITPHNIQTNPRGTRLPHTPNQR